MLLVLGVLKQILEQLSGGEFRAGTLLWGALFGGFATLLGALAEAQAMLLVPNSERPGS